MEWVTNDEYEQLIELLDQVRLETSDKCLALTGAGVQCSRRKRPECMFCTTHQYSQPYGTLLLNHTGNSFQIMAQLCQEHYDLTHYTPLEPMNYNGRMVLHDPQTGWVYMWNSRSMDVVGKLTESGFQIVEAELDKIGADLELEDPLDVKQLHECSKVRSDNSDCGVLWGSPRTSRC